MVEEIGHNNSTLATHSTNHHGGTAGNCSAEVECNNGKLIPLWQPSPLHVSPAERFGRAVVIVACLSYLFLGILIIVGKLIEALENIVTHKRRVRVISPTTGREEIIQVPVWNETVAHLAVAVIGSTAPEITLASVDVLAQNFTLGTLGPSVIVGSGAFNFFLVTAICMISVKRGQVKRVKELHICCVTAALALLAYVWVFLIIEVMSPNVIELWETLLTLFFFPTAIAIGYLANKKFFGCFSSAKSKFQRILKSVSPVSSNNGNAQNSTPVSNDAEQVDDDVEQLENARKTIERAERRFVEIESDLQYKHPEITGEQLAEMAELELVRERPKNMAFYRVQAARRMAGAEDIITQKNLQKAIDIAMSNHNSLDGGGSSSDRTTQTVSFEMASYSVVCGAGSLVLNIVRQTGDFKNGELSVGYRTADGTAKADVDYRHTDGRVTFRRGDTVKSVSVAVVDGTAGSQNEDSVFYVYLTEPRLVEPLTENGHHQHQHHPHFGVITPPDSSSSPIQVQLGTKNKVTVTKVAANHGGFFCLTTDKIIVEENVGEAVVKVVRSAGGKGNVVVPLKIESISAIPGKQFILEPGTSELYFSNEQTEENLKIKIIDEGKLDKKASLKVVLGEPRWATDQSIDVTGLNVPCLRDPSVLMLTIVESSKLKQIVDDIATMDVFNDLVVTTSSWREQLRSAFVVSGSSEDSARGEPKWHDYVLHFVALLWKFLVALTPPPNIWHGWPAGLSCLILMIFVTLLIDDLSVQLGCTLGLSEQMTAIVFVSLGTGLPDVFAARTAARREETADGALCHIYGASVATVFLGLGLAWTIATVHQNLLGKDISIHPGSLGFSVTLYFIFAACAITVLMLRRFSSIGGELGGPTFSRIATFLVFVAMWLIYVVLSAIDNYCIIFTY